MAYKKSIADLSTEDLKGKKVFVRVDFNVPLKDGQITDSTRIEKALPTIKYLIKKGSKIILASHLGRPKGQVNESLRLAPVSEKLAEMLGQNVYQANSCLGPEVESKVKNLKDGEVLLLENVRFFKEETENNPQFAQKLASYADLFVNDAFGAAHRAHASTVGIADYIPAYAGLLMQREIDFLGGILKNPAKPYLAIIGGAKVSSKIGILEKFLEKVDVLIIGGAMVFTFLKAKGKEIGTSICEEDKIDVAHRFLEKARQTKTKIVFPVDQVVVRSIEDQALIELIDIDHLPAGMKGVDIGPKTISQISDLVREAKTVFWNGPLGVFEIDAFAKGTFEVARTLAEAEATTIVGGGDSVAAVTQAGLSDKIDHVSTGGGASLEFLEGKELPGIAALEDKN
ncbi:phosphoglycerate kinase [Candidatus Margulisiibacteriota bacterium]